MNKVNVPQLRFSEFDGEWETITLGDLLTFKNGLNSGKEKYGKGIKFINVLDILNNNFITYGKIIGSVEVTEKEFEKNEVSYGDILFQRSSETRAEVGQANVYLDKNRSSVFGGFVIRGRAKYEYNPLFMNYLLRTPIARKEITDKSGGSTRYNVGQDTLSQVQLTTTIIPEQQKIASFLSAIDEKIQQLSRKKQLLEQYKKGVMQQLFSGKLRFKDKNGKDYPDWEEKRLGEISDIKKGKQLNKEELTETGEYLCINGGISPSGYTDKYNTLENTITISEGGNSCGFINFFKTKFWSGGHNYSIEILDPKETDNDFLFQILKQNQISLMGLRVGSGLPNIQKKDLLAFLVKLPTSILEQQKIANFLSNIDIKIENTNQEINKMQNFKKGLLQQMFV